MFESPPFARISQLVTRNSQLVTRMTSCKFSLTENQVLVPPKFSKPDEIQLLEQADIEFHASIAEVVNSWDNFVPEHRVFLRSAYLQALEVAPPNGMQSCYLTFSYDGQMIGIAACQVQHYRGDEPFNDEKLAQSTRFWDKVKGATQKFVTRQIRLNVMVCGSLLLTGEHGFYFHPKVNPEIAAQLLYKGLDKAAQEMGKRGKRIALFVLKDFSERTQKGLSPVFTDRKFYEFSIQPTMVLDIPHNWESFDDYLAAMSSKYRVRVKRAFKKGKNIVRKELNLAEIEENKQQIFDSYQNVAANAVFNTFTFTPDYFPELKRQLGDKFKLIACYIHDEFVGFYTTIQSGNELDAHFLGIDYQANRNAQLYLNMLYDMIRIGIDTGVHQIIFSRTALEIKSSVGAEPHDLFLYARHRNCIVNLFVKYFINSIAPKEEWVQRRPFKS